MASAAFLSEITGEKGVSPDRLSAALHITKSELALAAGLSRDAVSKAARSQSVVTQARLREVSEIINRVIPWAGSELAAYAWYRSQPLPSFGDATAEELVRQGLGEKVRAYLGRIAAGGFA
ncbi:antitoxin Xre/MbcA/ParS toxin-binding domain-containing protein [Novosphingobium sp. SCN 63-17]|uniref:antitoxin Xre/MbcA/ParS toxin-binding domain-containing protein n=1 Tax=Novosphingobium sp. SCN 63-17 TaxID=1660120 RepID=UPI00086C4F04|nr:antitoxin Xre/MbcA/ParS toxin-binding domain-containing protein [Novosphingobium sp. SCN 63-17]ODU77384.1 MAG: XRE family transcriptional regulator [Novosphingobium sp. SCN 63-17]